MGRKAKYPFKTKIDVVKRCLAGKTSMAHEATRLGIHRKVIADWITLYQSIGDNGLVIPSKNTFYSATLKQNAVEDYLNGKDSMKDICKKYKIRSDSQLWNWIKKYNSHEELKLLEQEESQS